MYVKLLLVYLSASALLQVSQEWVVDDTGCLTPDSGVGDCVEVYLCKPILRILEGDKKTGDAPLSQYASDILEKYLCGISNGPKVCCPRSGKIPTGTPDVAVTSPALDPRNLFPKSCGLIGDGDKVYNGIRAELFEFPWMALLSYETRNGNKFLCGGSLINDRYILTAAHCITKLAKNQKLSFVRLGEYDLNNTTDCSYLPDGDTNCADPVQDIQIAQVIPHEKYDDVNFRNDIGLLRLKTKANLKAENVRPICLPIADELRKVTLEKIMITGWGLTENQTTSNILMKARVQLMERKKCAKIYKNLQLNDGHMCAGGDTNATSCGGDSGGPIQDFRVYQGGARYIQYGVLSLGSSVCGVEGQPGIHTNIEYYLDWILSNVKP